ncbi:hypothetical protein [Labrys wisconsinensis]|uniref:Uncharacterized protein n=1 Tax=Labrys wisconsinensis TaxID=425677 RepID=A0ABU0JHS6_9HYPH|nr:hypothetical protein [Labrys wisconsinensis]MDQ0473841.1 hypothetical protein [Labrys wisconsinensis]
MSTRIGHRVLSAIFAVPTVLAAFFFGSALSGNAWEQLAWTTGLFLAGMASVEIAMRAIESEQPPST